MDDFYKTMAIAFAGILVTVVGWYLGNLNTRLFHVEQVLSEIRGMLKARGLDLRKERREDD